LHFKNLVCFDLETNFSFYNQKTIAALHKTTILMTNFEIEEFYIFTIH